MEKKLLELFTKNNCKKTNQKEFRIEKVMERIQNMSEYFLKPKSLGANVKVELDLSNYARKADLKNHTHVKNVGHTSKLLYGIY